MNYTRRKLWGIKKLMRIYPNGVTPPNVLSWFDRAHHDPEPRRMGRGSCQSFAWIPAKSMRE